MLARRMHLRMYITLFPASIVISEYSVHSRLGANLKSILPAIYHRKGDDLYLRFNNEESLFKWHSALLDPNTVPPYVDERIEVCSVCCVVCVSIWCGK